MFELVFDYGEHDRRLSPMDDTSRRRGIVAPGARQDPFSTYRAGFEVRTYRLCRRVLMFHHFPDELGRRRRTAWCGRPTSPIARSDRGRRAVPLHRSCASVTQSGYQRAGRADYRQASLPPLEFEYTRADDRRRGAASSTPRASRTCRSGSDGSSYQWVDLDGEGLSGILTEQAGGWFYKRNLSQSESAGAARVARFAPLELVAAKPIARSARRRPRNSWTWPATASSISSMFDGPTPGFYERDDDEGWEPFRPFASLPNRRLGRSAT